MPTNLRRFSVTVSPELEVFLVNDAKANHRAVAGQLTWIAEQYYLAKQREVDVLNRGRRGGSVEPFFHARKTPPQAAADA